MMSFIYAEAIAKTVIAHSNGTMKPAFCLIFRLARRSTFFHLPMDYDGRSTFNYLNY